MAHMHKLSSPTQPEICWSIWILKLRSICVQGSLPPENSQPIGCSGPAVSPTNAIIVECVPLSRGILTPSIQPLNSLFACTLFVVCLGGSINHLVDLFLMKFLNHELRLDWTADDPTVYLRDFVCRRQAKEPGLRKLQAYVVYVNSKWCDKPLILFSFSWIL